jgi:hypothetical protein
MYTQVKVRQAGPDRAERKRSRASSIEMDEPRKYNSTCDDLHHYGNKVEQGFQLYASCSEWCITSARGGCARRWQWLQGAQVHLQDITMTYQHGI